MDDVYENICYVIELVLFTMFLVFAIINQIFQDYSQATYFLVFAILQSILMVRHDILDAMKSRRKK